MLVYDITNTKSFDNLENWLRRIQEHGKANVEKMILGNKCDLEEKRMISKVTKENLGLVQGTKYKRSDDLNSIYSGEWTNAIPMKIFRQLATHPKLLIGSKLSLHCC